MKTTRQLKHRADGRLQRKVTVINAITGEKIKKIAYGHTAAELDADVERIKAIYGNVIFTGLTLERYLKEYIEERKKELTGVDGLNSLELYENTFKSHLYGTSFAALQLTDINLLEAKKFFNDFKSKRKGFTGARTKNLLFTILNTALKNAVYEGYLEANPLDRMRKPAYKSKEKGVIMTDTFNTILEMAENDNPQIANLFRFDILSGLRRSEIIALRFTDVNFNKGSVKITKALKRTKKYGLVQGGTKNRYSTRTVLLDNTSVEILRQQFLKAQRAYNEGKKAFNMDAFVFTDEDGKNFKPDRITKTFARYRDKLNLAKDITLHSLRHTAATNLAEHDIGTRKLQARFGWGSGMMADRYTHETEKMQEDIVKVLNKCAK
jgi:integrase